MKKAKKKGRATKRPKKTLPEPEVLKQVDLGDVSKQIITLVGTCAVQMVKETISQANEGHYLAMKCLFDLIGLCPAAAPAALQEDSLAKTLLQRLRIPGQIDPDQDVTKECVVEPVKEK
jgi:hypothetical protein